MNFLSIQAKWNSSLWNQKSRNQLFRYWPKDFFAAFFIDSFVKAAEEDEFSLKNDFQSDFFLEKFIWFRFVLFYILGLTILCAWNCFRCLPMLKFGLRPILNSWTYSHTHKHEHTQTHVYLRDLHFKCIQFLLAERTRGTLFNLCFFRLCVRVLLLFLLTIDLDLRFSMQTGRFLASCLLDLTFLILNLDQESRAKLTYRLEFIFTFSPSLFLFLFCLRT